MPSLTIRADQERLDALDAEADERGISRAKLVRERLDGYAALESEVAELETELERVRREKRQLLELRDEHTDLVKAVESEQSLAERRARAGLLTKAKWWAFGMGEE